jgi:hypothetical protein
MSIADKKRKGRAQLEVPTQPALDIGIVGQYRRIHPVGSRHPFGHLRYPL